MGKKVPYAWLRSSAVARETLLVASILLITALVHGINMFGCPQYVHDEGAFMARAWSFVTAGKFDPYSFTYDQTPLGYVQLGGWALLTGGFGTFGTAVDSGRALMLVLQVLSVLCVYLIARSVAGRPVVAAQAALLFALSPFGILQHRAVLLDNIATFWMLVSLVLLVSGRLSKRLLVLSAVAMGVSFLSKMPTIVVVPVFACLVVTRITHIRRVPATLAWIGIVGSVVSLYPLYALLRGELFQVGGRRGPSLIGGLKWQMSRGRDAGLFDPGSSFWHFVKVWRESEPVLVIGGTLGALICILAIRQYRTAGVIGLSPFCFWVLYGRGGVVEIYYLIPAMPLLAISLALCTDGVVSALRSSSSSVWIVTKWALSRDLRDPLLVVSLVALIALGHTGLGLLLVLACHVCASAATGSAPSKSPLWRWILARDPRLPLAAISLAVMLALGYTSHRLQLDRDHLLLWREQRTAAQRAAIQWVSTHVPTKSTVIVEPFMWTDLHDGVLGGRVWPNAMIYIRFEHDRLIREGVFHEDWRAIDYVVGGRSVINFAFRSPHPRFVRVILLAEALKRSHIVAAFDSPGYPVWVFRVERRIP